MGTDGKNCSANECAGTFARISESRPASRIFYNVYGPHGTYDGGREKAPAAVCRKVIQAKLNDRLEIEIWGTGAQTRSCMYIDDCQHGTQMLLKSDFVEPINIGSNEMVSINQLTSI